MHISWSFLDKRKAAVSAMEAFDSMDFIVKHSDEEIQRVENRMVGVGSQNLDGMPHAHNPQAGEERMIKGIEEIDTIKERYRQAVEYIRGGGADTLRLLERQMEEAAERLEFERAARCRDRLRALGQRALIVTDGVAAEKDIQIVGAVDIESIGKEVVIGSGVLIEDDIERMIDTKDPDIGQNVSGYP